jgi:hypothetical protein
MIEVVLGVSIVLTISPLLSAPPLRVLHAPILLGASIAVSLMLPMIISVLSGAIDSTEIGSRRDTKRCMSGNICGLPPLTILQAAVVDCK